MGKIQKTVTGRTRQEIIRNLLCNVSVFITLLAVLCYVHYRTQFLEVEIALPSENEWHYANRSIRVWADDPKYYIWRSETIVYQRAPDNLDTKEAVVKYIDNQLVEHGWKSVHFEVVHPCDPVLPESEFLEWESTYWAYKQEDWIDYQRGTPTLCLAVWQIENNDGFHVVVMTQNPSLLTRLRYVFD